MDPQTMMMIANGVAALQKSQNDARQNRATTMQRAAEIAYSPWTKIAPSTQISPRASMGSDLMGAAAASMAQKQEMDKYNADQAMRNEWMNILKSERAGKATPQDQAFGFAPYQPVDRLGLYKK